jgi:GT2 family glycosyltransferase
MIEGREWPIAVRSVEVSVPVAPITDVIGYPRTRVFVRQTGTLVGSVDIWNGGGPISATRLRQAIAGGLAWPLMRRALEGQLGERHEANPNAGARTSGEAAMRPMSVSVVIATCNRPDDLRRCLSSLRALRPSIPLELVVVDNRPAGGATPAVVREFGDVRFIEEPRPGLSYARNAGFMAASGDIAIAIDDDVTVPQGWLERLVAPFSRREVMCVTGNVLPVALDTEAQCRFEAYGGLGKGFEPIEAGPDWFRAWRTAVPTWRLGATANAAFRRSIFFDPRIGLLDEALGAGMPTGCSEDTYLFYRILKAGYTIVYDPAAWVWHRHRVEQRSLRHQIFSYSKGHVAYQLTTLAREGDRRALVRLLYSLPRVYAARTWERLRGRSEYPLPLIATEVLGTLAGPLALWRARRRVRRLGPSLRTQPHAVSVESPVTETSGS